ncbi:hypothetical protein AAMO2058_000976100 [Amorphochlora amoebiformis]
MRGDYGGIGGNSSQPDGFLDKAAKSIGSFMSFLSPKATNKPDHTNITFPSESDVESLDPPQDRMSTYMMGYGSPKYSKEMLTLYSPNSKWSNRPRYANNTSPKLKPRSFSPSSPSLRNFSLTPCSKTTKTADKVKKNSFNFSAVEEGKGGGGETKEPTEKKGMVQKEEEDCGNVVAIPTIVVASGPKARKKEKSIRRVNRVTPTITTVPSQMDNEFLASDPMQSIDTTQKATVMYTLSPLRIHNQRMGSGSLTTLLENYNSSAIALKRASYPTLTGVKANRASSTQKEVAVSHQNLEAYDAEWMNEI